jgi:hypothetical protein
MFSNRQEAGKKLGAWLKDRPWTDPVVLAIPRGGIVVGAELAEALNAELDVVLARKLRAPGQAELAIGAIAENGNIYINPDVQDLIALNPEYLAQEKSHQEKEIARRKQIFRKVRPHAHITGRSVIITDDGMATGSTMKAALRVVREQNPNEIVVALPVAASDRLDEIRPLCDLVVCLLAPDHFWAIGQFYRDFSQVEDIEVIQLLKKFAPVGSGK